MKKLKSFPPLTPEEAEALKKSLREEKSSSAVAAKGNRPAAKGDLLLSPWTTPPKKKHPLALSGGRHPPDRASPPKFSTPPPTKEGNISTASDASPRPSEARTQAKGPASGTMSHVPDNVTQRGSVASGGDASSNNIIGGVEAVQRAASEAERKKLESELWGIGMGRSH